MLDVGRHIVFVQRENLAENAVGNRVGLAVERHAAFREEKVAFVVEHSVEHRVKHATAEHFLDDLQARFKQIVMGVGRFLDARQHIVGDGSLVGILPRIRHSHGDEQGDEQEQKGDEKPFQTRIFLLARDFGRSQRTRSQNTIQFFYFTGRCPVFHVFRPDQSVGCDAHFAQLVDAKRTLMFLVFNDIIFHVFELIVDS